MLRVDPSNAEQARAWDGDEGEYWATHAEHFDRALAGYQHDLMAAAAIEAGSRVLDIGCGSGQTTRAAARAATGGTALGVDLSGRMLDLARRIGAEEGLENVTFEQADAQVHPFAAASFDRALSRTGTMFFGDARAAFTNIARALEPGGRLAILVWQGPEPNEWLRELSGALAAGRELGGPPVGAPGPFAMADPASARSVLQASGFTDVQIDGLSAPMWFGADVAAAHAFVLGLMGWMLQGLDDAGRARASDALAASLEAHAAGLGVTYESATWLIRARAR